YSVIIDCIKYRLLHEEEGIRDRNVTVVQTCALPITRGEWGSIGNIIYSNWEKQDLSDMKNTFDNTFNGLDFGFADDPTAFIRLHLDNKRKTIYIFDEFALRGLFIDDIAEELQERIASEYITCDSAEP